MNVRPDPFPAVETATPIDPAVEASGIELSYGDTPILKGIDLDVVAGRTLALLGSSGSGKTTLLRLVAGLLSPDRGTIRLAGRLVAGGRTLLPPERRGLGMVFQDYALWPHMTIGQNVSFPLEMLGIGRAEREARVRAALTRVGLAGREQRSPAELSGGQQQRVAIARAIVAEPRIVLFDEPLSNLDRELRETMVEEIAELVATLGLTALYVTHDHSEAFSFADEVAVMAEGRVAQRAPPQRLVAEPASAETARFLKLGAVLRADIRGASAVLQGTDLPIAAAPLSFGPAGSGEFLVPNGAARISEPGVGTLAAEVVRCRFRGDAHAIVLRLGPTPEGATIHVASDRPVRIGERVHLSIDHRRLRWFLPSPTEEKVAPPC